MNPVAQWIEERKPPGRTLEPDELTELAIAIGEERPLWEHLVRHDENERIYVELYRDTHLDVWLICWLNQQETGFHDHDLSGGAVYVCDGVLSENRLHVTKKGIQETAIDREAGTVFYFDAARVHRMLHTRGKPATSIHVYSPALWRMGHYDFDLEGNLRRESITYADEMWSGLTAGAGAFIR